MNIVTVISVNARTRRKWFTPEKGVPVAIGHRSIKGRAECIVRENGQLVTKHCLAVSKEAE